MSYSVIVVAATAVAITYRYLTKQTVLHAKQLEYDADTENNIYDECPKASFAYDKEHYLASESFAQFIDQQIQESKVKEKRNLSGFGQYVNIEKK